MLNERRLRNVKTRREYLQAQGRPVGGPVCEKSGLQWPAASRLCLRKNLSGDKGKIMERKDAAIQLLQQPQSVFPILRRMAASTQKLRETVHIYKISWNDKQAN